MYIIEEIYGVNASPWEIPISNRIKMVRDSLIEGHKLCILLCEYPEPTIFRYRGFNLMQITQKESEWKCVYFFSDEWVKVERWIFNANLICIVRVRWTKKLDLLIAKMKLMDKPVLFDVDDLVFDLAYLPYITNTVCWLSMEGHSDKSYDYWSAYIARIGMTASRSTAYLSTNDFLGQLLQKKYNAPFCGIIPNFLNEEQLFVSREYRNQKLLQSHEPFTIGYFSGTPSHVNDFKVIEEELIRIMDEFPGINLRIVGFMKLSDRMQALARKGRVSLEPLTDFVKLQKLIAEVDVNIVPLVESTFTNCKSDLKFFEAAIVNTITLATPTYAYNKIIRHGENGFLCRQGEWYLLLKEIILKKIEIKPIVKQALEDALYLYTGETILKKINDQYNQILNEFSKKL